MTNKLSKPRGVRYNRMLTVLFNAKIVEAVEGLGLPILLAGLSLQIMIGQIKTTFCIYIITVIL